MPSEVVRIKGVKVTIHQLPSGRWAASSGYGTGVSDTKEGAIRDVSRQIQSGKDESDRQSRDRQEEIRQHEAKTTMCPVCHVRVSNLKVHERSARHKNALAYENSRHTSRY